MQKRCFNWQGLLAMLLALCLMIPLVPKADAASLGGEEDEIELYYTGTISVSASINILSSGVAECWGHVGCYPGYTAEADMRLQWLDGTIWRNYKSWSGDGDFVGFDESCSVPEGRKYRVKVIADIYDENGNWVETVGATSGSENS